MDKTYRVFEEKISASEIVSIELFDLLVERPFMSKKDILDFMSIDAQRVVGRSMNFAQMREAAELAAKRRRKVSCVDLNEIYEEFGAMCGLTPAQIMEVEKIEILHEQRYYRERILGKQIFNMARTLNKKVVIVAQTPMPRFVVEGLLERFGYAGYADLFISGELKFGKEGGEIYKHIAAKLGSDPKYCLHIGPDERLDGHCATAAGFVAMPLLSTHENYKQTYYFQNIWKQTGFEESLSSRLVNGVLSLKFFETSHGESLNSDLYAFNADKYRMGYFALGPALLGYAQWVLQRVQEDNIRNVYFLGSNNTLLQEAIAVIVRNYSQQPNFHNILYSEHVEKFVRLSKICELKKMTEEAFNKETLGDFFKKRLGVDLQEAFQEEQKRHNVTQQTTISEDLGVWSFLDEVLPHIAKQNEQYKSSYKAYLKLFSLPNPDRSAIIEVSSDKSQEVLAEAVGQRIEGYYLKMPVSFSEKLMQIGMRSSAWGGSFSNTSISHRLELVFGSHENIFKHFTINGNMLEPNYEERKDASPRLAFLSEAGRGALDFVRDFNSIYHRNLIRQHFTADFLLKPLNFFFERKEEHTKILGSNLTSMESGKPKDSKGFMQAIERVFSEIKKTL